MSASGAQPPRGSSTPAGAAAPPSGAHPAAGAQAPASAQPREAKAVRCPQCGAPIALRALGQSVMAACAYCHSQIDVSQPEIRLIQAYHEREERLHLALGTRGTLGGQIFEVIGAMQRCDVASDYRWEEYLLFNPFVGFRWLVYDAGHWNLGRTVKDTSKITVLSDLFYEGHRYRKFNQGRAVVTWVVGEFYWRVKVGDRAETTDYVAPPLMLSREKSDDEITWTLLQYLEPDEVRSAFQIVSSPPRTSVSPNQTNPASAAWRSVRPVMWAALAASLLIQIGSAFATRGVQYSVGTYDFPRKPGEETQVYGPFSLPAHRSVNELTATAPLSNNWVELNGSLVETTTGQSFEFANAFEYYYGVDGDGAWSEGSTQGTSLLSAVPAGTYKLIVDGATGAGRNQPTSVALALRHDVLSWQNFWLALTLILSYPAYLLFRRLAFERERWSESDLGSHR